MSYTDPLGIGNLFDNESLWFIILVIILCCFCSGGFDLGFLDDNGCLFIILLIILICCCSNGFGGACE